MEIDIKSLLKLEKWPNAFGENVLFNKVPSHWFHDFFIIYQENFTITKSDNILILDVLDHCSCPQTLLQNVKKCCNAGSEIDIIVHPYTSRLATHNKNNKAFSHFFTESELHHNKLKTHVEYKNLFEKNGFVITQTVFFKQNVEDWFFAPSIRKPIEATTGFSLDSNHFKINMINYTLRLCQ